MTASAVSTGVAPNSAANSSSECLKTIKMLNFRYIREMIHTCVIAYLCMCVCCVLSAKKLERELQICMASKRDDQELMNLFDIQQTLDTARKTDSTDNSFTQSIATHLYATIFFSFRRARRNKVERETQPDRTVGHPLQGREPAPTERADPGQHRLVARSHGARGRLDQRLQAAASRCLSTAVRRREAPGQGARHLREEDRCLGGSRQWRCSPATTTACSSKWQASRVGRQQQQQQQRQRTAQRSYRF